MSILGKVSRFVGNSAIRDLGYAEMASSAIGKVGAAISTGAKGAIVKHTYRPGTGFIEKVVESPLGYDIKTRYALGISAVVAAPVMLDSGIKVRNRSSLGEISGGELTNQVNESGSPTFKDEGQLRKLSKDSLTNSILKGAMSTHGAEGDIVFALHNLRRG